MIICSFEEGQKANLRHITTNVICEKDGAILLVKRADFLGTEPGKWGLPGGYVDRDERVEESAIREFLEETGWRGEIISLFRINSNPNRPNEKERQNVAIEFLVKPIEKIGTPDSESSKVEWIPIEKIKLDGLAFDFEDTLNLYFDYKKGKIKLPIIE